MRHLWLLLPPLALSGCFLFGGKSSDDDDDDDDDDVVDTGDITGGEGGGGEGGGSGGSGGSADADGDGYTTGEGDCDDENGAINPEATDVVGDSIDQNCDGVDGTDADGDGWASEWSGGTDCNDDDPCLNHDDADGDGTTSCEGDSNEDCVDGETWPVADAGPDQLICEDASFQLDGSGSYDPDGSIVSYEWTLGSIRESGVTVTPSYGPDEGYSQRWELTVTDDDGKTDTDEVVIYGNDRPSWTRPTVSGDCSNDGNWLVRMDDGCFGNYSCVCTIQLSASDPDSTASVSVDYRYSSQCESQWDSSISGSTITLRHSGYSSSVCRFDVTIGDECTQWENQFEVVTAPAG